MAGSRIEDSWMETSSSTTSPPSSPRPAARSSRFTRSTLKQRSGKNVDAPTQAQELVMPSLDPDTLEASWAESRSSRNSRSPKKSSKAHTTQSNRAATSPADQSVRSVSQTDHNTPDTLEVFFGHIGTMLSHMFDILARSLRLLKTPLSMALAAFLLLQLGLIARSFIISSIYSSMSPLCMIPGSSFLNLPFCPTTLQNNQAEGQAEFDQLMRVQSKFEDVLKETAIGITLPIDMKRSEAGIRDLRQLVRYSHLTSKQELGLEFDGFIDTAKQASYDLQKFNSHVGRAVDQVLSTTRWTLRVIDDIAVREASRGSIDKLSSKLLMPFAAAKVTEAALLDQYIKHASSIEEQLHTLISEAMLLLMVLNNLDDRLEIIHSIVIREDTHISATRSEVLGELWTLVGGNRKTLSKMNNQLNLLKQVNTYRTTAYAHVSGTMLKLQEIASGLEDLRERVGTPANLRDRIDIPLEVHLQNIQLGVERLEGTREAEKKKEIGNLGRHLEKRESDGGTLIDG